MWQSINLLLSWFCSSHKKKNRCVVLASLDREDEEPCYAWAWKGSSHPSVPGEDTKVTVMRFVLFCFYRFSLKFNLVRHHVWNLWNSKRGTYKNFPLILNAFTLCKPSYRPFLSKKHLPHRNLMFIKQIFPQEAKGNFQGETIRPLVPRHNFFIVYQ